MTPASLQLLSVHTHAHTHSLTLTHTHAYARLSQAYLNVYLNGASLLTSKRINNVANDAAEALVGVDTATLLICLYADSSQVESQTRKLS